MSAVWIWDYYKKVWVKIERSKDDAIATTSQMSLAYIFCEKLRISSRRNVCLILFAAGGTQIAEWLPKGGAVAKAEGRMFRRMVWLYDAAINTEIPILPNGWRTLVELPENGADVLLWHQGEADANYRGTTGPQWMARFLRLMSIMRRSTGIGKAKLRLLKDEAPILVGKLLVGGKWRQNSTDDRNVDIAKLARRDPSIKIVSSQDLESCDGLHFSPSALRIFGRRYFAVFSRSQS